jgi:hypothetical protein
MRKRFTEAEVAQALYSQPTKDNKAAWQTHMAAKAGLKPKAADPLPSWVSRLDGRANPAAPKGKR